jgi:hypothetical protein
MKSCCDNASRDERKINGGSTKSEPEEMCGSSIISCTRLVGLTTGDSAGI